MTKTACPSDHHGAVPLEVGHLRRRPKAFAYAHWGLPPID